MAEAVWERWLQSLRASGVKGMYRDEYDQLVEYYSQEHRAYHTLAHLTAMFCDLDCLPKQSPCIDWAVWFHDLIYVPGRADNERLSADSAVHALIRFGLAEADVTLVRYMILCTRNHQNPQKCPHTQRFLDADMAILGAEPSVYNTYLQNLRYEYQRIPKWLFRRGRKKFIKQVLALPKIYQSEAFFALYEQQARTNLRQELTAMSGVLWWF